uniref:Uncharacterized protein n=1 Tax=Rhizophora mucronata TaxID=61149 RepID=A0A2P2LQJ8_RHIMU
MSYRETTFLNRNRNKERSIDRETHSRHATAYDHVLEALLRH